MKHKCFFVAALLAVLAAPLRAQFVVDGATNTLSNTTNSFPGDTTVGSSGSFSLLVISNNALLANALNGVIGLNASAKSNDAQLVSASARWQIGGSLFVGSNGAMSRLVVSNGAYVEDFSGTLAFRAASSNNFALVTGTNSLWTNRSDLRIGNLGAGNQLVVSNGGFVANKFGYIGGSSSASNNSALISGSSSVWSNQFDLYVGFLNGASNRLVIEAGGLVVCDNGLVGESGGSSNNEALVTGAGSAWSNLTRLVVGLNGTVANRLTVSNGAVVWNGSGGGGGVGGRSNQVLVTGSGSLWTNQGYWQVGGSGNRVDVNNGGVLAGTDGTLGGGFGSTNNTFTLADSGSTWNNSGVLKVGDGGDANTLIASNGATLLSSTALIGASTSLGNNNFALLTGAGTLWSNRNDFTVGNFSVGNRLDTSSGATLYVGGNAVVGANVGANNNLLNVSGPPAKFQVASNIYVGSNGAFNQCYVSLGTLESGTTFVGYGSAASNNSLICYNVTRWTNHGKLFVGYGGGGNLLSLSSGALMSIQDDTWIGFGAGGPSHSNTVTVNELNARWAGNVVSGNPNIFMGSNGAFNRLLITDGGQVTSSGGHIGYATSGSNNTVLVTGTNTLWDASTINVGEFSAGNILSVSNGAVINCFAGTVGSLFFADNNVAIVTGAGSFWTNRFSLTVGGGGSSNLLLATNGGTVICLGPVTVGAGTGTTGNRVTVDGGALMVTNASGTGALDVRRGTNVLNAGRIEADKLWVTNAAGRFELKGGTLVTREANIIQDALEMGLSATPAVWDVHGTNNFLSGHLTVGRFTPMNQMLITNGASLTNAGLGFIGNTFGAVSNVVFVSGPGSQWQMGSSLLVGGGAFNRLEVGNGGAVTSLHGTIGGGSSNNLAMVTGSGSLWNAAGQIQVGDNGTQNQLVISDAATVRSASGILGTQANASNNLALVTDPGSLWSMTGELDVGVIGSRNQLVVSNGASVFANNLVIGSTANSLNNRVTVTGGYFLATNAAGTGFLDVRRGTNALNSGLIEVDSLLVTNPAGILEFNGGTLSARNTSVNNGQVFRVGNGTSPATFNLAGNGTHSFANGGFVDTQGAFTGSGTVIGTLQILGGAMLSPGTPIGKIAFSNAPTLSGAVLMEISKNGTFLTNDVIQVAGALFYGGVLTVTKIGPTALAEGDRFQLFTATSYLGSFTTLTLPPLTPGLSWTNKLVVDGSIEVVVVPQPKFSNISVSATNVIISGTGGVPNSPYAVLSATNVDTPLSNWMSLFTNLFDASGNFSFTNAIAPGTPQRFFQIRTP